MPGTGNMLSPTIPLPKLWTSVEATKSSDYTCLQSDTGTLFLTGGAATRTFTLPTLALGGNFWALFYNVQGNSMVITAPANKLIAINNATGTTATYSTASKMIGAFCLIWMNDAGTFYHHANLSASCPETIT